MLVKTVIDNENGKKWEINKVDNNRYTVTYYEFFQSIGWKEIKMGPVEYWDKESIEFEFECEVA